MFVTLPSAKGGYVSIPIDHIFLIEDTFQTPPPDPPMVEVDFMGLTQLVVNDADPDYVHALKECGMATLVHFYRGGPSDTTALKTTLSASAVTQAIERVRSKSAPSAATITNNVSLADINPPNRSYFQAVRP